jgi:hypothetical protein
MLKTTDNILNVKKIFNSDLLKYYFKITESNVLLQILCDEYQFVTCNIYSKMVRPFVESFTIPFESKYNDIITVKNNNIYINEYIFLPVGKYYKFGVNSAYYYYYLNIINSFPDNSDVVVVQTLGPWEIENNKLYMFFEIENLLIKERNCKVRTVFLLISYGEDIKYNEIIIDNNEQKDYIIIDCNDFTNFNKIKTYINNTQNIIIDSINLQSMKSCYNELMSLPLLMITCNELLKCLNLNGNLYLNMKTFHIYKPSFDFYYLINNLFEKFEILNNNIVYLHLGFFKFSNYKDNGKNTILNNIIEEYVKEDKYLGQNFYHKEQGQEQDKLILINCKTLNNNKNKPNVHTLIKSIKIENINNDFLKIFINAYKKYNKMLKRYYKRIITIKTILDKDDKLKTTKTINLVLVNNISKSIEYCLKNNIEINEIYDNPKIPNFNDIINIYFPKKKDIDQSKLEISLDSAFSISKPNDLIRLSKLIKTNTPFVKYIIDGTSNIGIGAIIFSDYFQHVYAVEYNKLTCKKLKKNIQVYKLKNVTVLCDDIIQTLKERKIKFDKNKYCLFLDPPWSGYYYKVEKKVNLYLNDIDILKLIKDIDIKYIYIKVPHNYDFSNLYHMFYNVTVYRFNGYYIIYLIK